MVYTGLMKLMVVGSQRVGLITSVLSMVILTRNHFTIYSVSATCQRFEGSENM